MVPEPGEPTVHLTMSFPDFIQLGCGRTWPDSSPAQARERVLLSGDPVLAERVLEVFNVAP